MEGMMALTDLEIKKAWEKAKARCEHCGVQLEWTQRDCERYSGGWTIYREDGSEGDSIKIVCCICDKQFRRRQ
jgi:hypothetical protein